MYQKLFLALLGSSSAHADASRRVFSDLGLSEGQPKILYILRQTGGLMQKILAKQCGIKESTLTVALSKMEASGLIRRERAVTEKGKASYRVFLTEKGSEMAIRLETEIERLEACGLRGFSKEEQSVLLAMLSRVTQNLKSD